MRRVAATHKHNISTAVTVPAAAAHVSLLVVAVVRRQTDAALCLAWREGGAGGGGVGCHLLVCCNYRDAMLTILRGGCAGSTGSMSANRWGGCFQSLVLSASLFRVRC